MNTLTRETLDMINKIEQGNQLANRSFESINIGDFNAALSYAERASELNPRNVIALQVKALCKYSLLVESDETLSPQIQEVMHDLMQALTATHQSLAFTRNFIDTIIDD